MAATVALAALATPAVPPSAWAASAVGPDARQTRLQAATDVAAYREQIRQAMDVFSGAWQAGPITIDGSGRTFSTSTYFEPTKATWVVVKSRGGRRETTTCSVPDDQHLQACFARRNNGRWRPYTQAATPSRLEKAGKSFTYVHLSRLIAAACNNVPRSNRRYAMATEGAVQAFSVNGRNKLTSARCTITFGPRKVVIKNSTTRGTRPPITQVKVQPATPRTLAFPPAT